MKWGFISDIHGSEQELTLPDGLDVIACCGDVCNYGTENEYRRFIKWYGQQPARAKIYVPGNHDIYCERHTRDARQFAHAHGVTYVQDESKDVLGMTLWGSPQTPTFGRGWAFNKDRGETIKRYWDAIPDDTQVLITHGPPHGILDQVLWPPEHRAGCEELRERVGRLPALRVHAFGHLHNDGGQREVIGSTTFINAALLDDNYDLVRGVQIIDL